MKNGRALQGHRRTLVGNGENLPRRPPPGGWTVGCICGWNGGSFPRSKPALAAYRSHLEELIEHAPFLCKTCREVKPIAEMRADYRYMCLACFSKKGNDWQRANPVQAARHKRDSHLRKKFDITLAEQEELLAAQGGGCGICGDPILDKRGYGPHIDHDHESGEVRGILCFGCNAGLGLFKDQVPRLKAAAAYLERHQVLGELPEAIARELNR